MHAPPIHRPGARFARRDVQPDLDDHGYVEPVRNFRQSPMRHPIVDVDGDGGVDLGVRSFWRRCGRRGVGGG
jgi:hypothetical protein